MIRQANPSPAGTSQTQSVPTFPQGRFLKSAFFFTVLLNMKHIFLYLAPAYFVFLLRNYCLSVPAGDWLPRPQIANTVKLAAVVLGVFALSLAPFVALGQLPQASSELERGGRDPDVSVSDGALTCRCRTGP